MQSATFPFEGVLPIDKPTGLTSHDVVDRVRHKLRMKRIGHAGTLDPMATGLLLILVGKSTKLSQYLMNMDKTYAGTLRLGITTDTHDCDGEVAEEKPVPPLNREEVAALWKTFVGDQYQIPPMFSAKKVGGVPLYKLARQGQTIERDPRFIRVSSIEMTRFELPEIDFVVRCSKGTYVRTIAHDLGQKLGCGATLIALRRTAIEHFQVAQAPTLESFEEMTPTELHQCLIPSYQAVPSQML